MADYVLTLSLISNFSEFYNNSDLFHLTEDNERFFFNREEKIRAQYYYSNSEYHYNTYPIRDAVNILYEPTYNPNLKTIIYLHGYSENPEEHRLDQSIDHIVKAFLVQNRVNLIVFNYAELVGRSRPFSVHLEYFRSAFNVPFIGRTIGNFLSAFLAVCGCLDRIHLIGFSLGSHIAHYASKVLSREGFLLPRITGLEPARPLFYRNILLEQLSPNDAYFVDVVHTSSNEFGWPDHIGHADFWPNKGISFQPYCAKYEPENASGCSHVAAAWYYAASILRPDLFQAIWCESADKWEAEGCVGNKVVPFGYYLQYTEGDYYFSTYAEYPFGKGYAGTFPSQPYYLLYFYK